MTDNNECRIIENFPLKPGEFYNNIEFVGYIDTDKYGNHNCIFKCPIDGCCNFFKTQLNNVYSGHTKSCRKHGRLDFTPNPSYSPIYCDFVVIFYKNYDDGFFIIDKADYDIVSKHTWTADFHYNKQGEITRIVPVTTIDNKKVSLSKFLMNNPDGLDVDHINHQTNDFRKINLRVGTKQQNLDNRPVGQGKITQNQNNKYKIINYTKEDVSGLEFETYTDAVNYLIMLWDKHSGEFSYYRSQQKAKLSETYEFVDLAETYDGEFPNTTLEKINQLPERKLAKMILRNIVRDMITGAETPLRGNQKLYQLSQDYENGVFD